MRRSYEVARLAAGFLGRPRELLSDAELERAVHLGARLLELAEELYPEDPEGDLLERAIQARLEVERILEGHRVGADLVGAAATKQLSEQELARALEVRRLAG